MFCCQCIVRCIFITKYSVSVLSDPSFTTSVYPVCCMDITRSWQYTGYSASVLSEIKNYSQCHTSLLSVCCQTDIYVTSLLSVCRQSVVSVLSVCCPKQPLNIHVLERKVRIVLQRKSSHSLMLFKSIRLWIDLWKHYWKITISKYSSASCYKMLSLYKIRKVWAPTTSFSFIGW